MKNEKKAGAAEEQPKATETKGTVLAVQTDGINLNLPDLDKAQVFEADLVGEYWSPETVGEKRRMIFTGIEQRQKVDFETGEVIEGQTMDTALFMYKKDGAWIKVANAGAVLVGALQSVKPGSALEITYTGEKKNRNNNFKSRQWSVKYLQA